jgi:hypothetical protein
LGGACQRPHACPLPLIAFTNITPPSCTCTSHPLPFASSASRATGDGSPRRRRGLGSNANIRIIAIGLGFYSVMTLFIGSSFISVQLVVDSPDTSYQTLFLPKTKTSNQDQLTPTSSTQTIHNQTKEEQIVVLHAGPHKTGTTSL